MHTTPGFALFEGRKKGAVDSVYIPLQCCLMSIDMYYSLYYEKKGLTSNFFLLLYQRPFFPWSPFFWSTQLDILLPFSLLFLIPPGVPSKSPDTYLPIPSFPRRELEKVTNPISGRTDEERESQGKFSLFGNGYTSEFPNRAKNKSYFFKFRVFFATFPYLFRRRFFWGKNLRLSPDSGLSQSVALSKFDSRYRQCSGRA